MQDKNLPMSPGKALESVRVNPGAVTQLALEDLDFGILAFLVLAACTAGRCFFCRMLIGSGLWMKHVKNSCEEWALNK